MRLEIIGIRDIGNDSNVCKLLVLKVIKDAQKSLLLLKKKCVFDSIYYIPLSQKVISVFVNLFLDSMLFIDKLSHNTSLALVKQPT